MWKRKVRERFHCWRDAFVYILGRASSYESVFMFSVFGNRHGWLTRDNVRLANSFVLSADWPSDFAAEHAE